MLESFNINDSRVRKVGQSFGMSTNMLHRTKGLGHTRLWHINTLYLSRRYLYAYIIMMSILKYIGFIGLFWKPLNTQHKPFSLLCPCHVICHLFRGCHVLISMCCSLCWKPNTNVQSNLKTSTTYEILTHLLVHVSWKKLLRTRNLSFAKRVKFMTLIEHG